MKKFFSSYDNLFLSVLCGDAQLNPQNTRVAVISFDADVHNHVSLLSPPAQSYLDYNETALGEYIFKNIE